MIIRQIIRIFVILVLFVSAPLNAQTIKINANKKALSNVFDDLKDNYKLQFSYNYKLLSNCYITDTNTYKSPEIAIKSLVANCNLSYKKENDVFVIYKEQIKNKNFYFSSQIVDEISGEPLPFSNIIIDSLGTYADVNGNFSFKSKDSIINIEISHIGYYKQKLELKDSVFQIIKITPSINNLDEVIINSNSKVYNSFLGEKAGLIKLNTKIATFLPGNSDNTIFNLLRLQSGVLAAGEQTKDYMLWGSYKGQTQVIFDGISLFSVSSMNNNIGLVNPLIMKDIEVYKGAYNVDKGNRVGGLINIIGNSGNNDNIKAKLNINTQTANGYLNIPFAKKYTLQLSYRHTYYNLLDWQYKMNQINYKDAEIFKTDYSFGDANIKFTGKSNNGDNYYISLLNSNDNEIDSIDYTSKLKDYHVKNETSKQQQGGAFFYAKNWKKAGITNITLSYSSLETNYNNLFSFTDTSGYITNSSETENTISEQSIKINHYFLPIKNHNFKTGISIINNTSGFIQTKSKNYTDNNAILSYYLLDKINIKNLVVLSPGFKLDYVLNNTKLYFQPRINMSVKANKNLKFNLAYGIYRQYINENAIIDELNNYLFYWDINSNLSASHYVLGLSYNLDKFNINIEGYYKNTDGLNRFIIQDIKADNYLANYTGDSKSKGIDFSVNRKFNKHSFWLSYSLSEIKEHFSYFNSDNYELAPHNQLQEIKTAVLLNFSPYFLSANYVYGSGLENSRRYSNTNTIIPYSRLDIAFLYKFNLNKIKFETGISILNLLNTKNVRFNNFSNFPDDKTINSPATPFTPLIFLNLRF